MPSPFRAPWIRRILLCLLALPLALWMGLAMALRLPAPSPLAAILGICLPATALFLLIRLKTSVGLASFALAFLVVLAGFMAARPSNHRDWMPDVATVPRGELEGDRLLIRNVRNCRYRTESDVEVRFEDRAYDLNRLQGMDLFLVSWGPRHIAHTILSFDFGQGSHLAFSVETRKEKTEAYSALRGFFREYELCIVAGDERDLISLRTNHRKEICRLYRLNTPPMLARQVLTEYVKRINGLVEHPEWYNALSDNCTTAMIGPIRHLSDRLPWSWKLIASGHLDELLYENGFLHRTLPFPELRERAIVNTLAERAGQDPAFSTLIRANQPPP